MFLGKKLILENFDEEEQRKDGVAILLQLFPLPDISG